MLVSFVCFCHTRCFQFAVVSFSDHRYSTLLHDWKSERLTGLTRKLGVSGVKDGEIAQGNVYIINTNDVPVSATQDTDKPEVQPVSEPESLHSCVLSCVRVGQA